MIDAHEDEKRYPSGCDAVHAFSSNAGKDFFFKRDRWPRRDLAMIDASLLLHDGLASIGSRSANSNMFQS